MFPAILLGAMAGLQVVGGVMQYQQMKAAGQLAKKAGRYEQALAENRAISLGRQAVAERAASQQAMLAARSQGALVSGRTRALAAASGASMSSPSIVKALTDIGMQEDYNVGTLRAQGEMQAENLEYGAQLERAGGQQARALGSYQKQLADQQAVMALAGGLLGAAGTGYGAYQAFPSGGTGRASGMEMGRFGTTPGLMQYGSPLYTKYGFGGPGI